MPYRVPGAAGTTQGSDYQANEQRKKRPDGDAGKISGGLVGGLAGLLFCGGFSFIQFSPEFVSRNNPTIHGGRGSCIRGLIVTVWKPSTLDPAARLAEKLPPFCGAKSRATAMPTSRLARVAAFGVELVGMDCNASSVKLPSCSLVCFIPSLVTSPAAEVSALAPAPIPAPSAIRR